MEQKLFIGFPFQESYNEKDLSAFSLTKRDQKEYLGIFLLGNKPSFRQMLEAKQKILSYFSPLIQEKDLFIFTQLFLG